MSMIDVTAEKTSIYEDALSSLENTTSDLECIPEEEVEKPRRARESFRSKTSYLLTIIGFTVGFGNFWRFPTKFQTYGGVFFLPYILSVIFVGLPVMYLEMAIGQRLRNGPVGCWSEISPYFGGIGISTGFVCLFIGFYYNALIAYCLSYLVDSVHRTLPWTNCELAVNHVLGRSGTLKECAEANFPSKYYWYRVVLDVSENIDTIGNFNWQMYVCILVAWIMVGTVLIKGMEFSSKVVYFTATFPYYVLSIFLVFGWTLHGFYYGYKEMFIFEFDRLTNPKIWLDAMSQVLYSLGVGSGVLISYASCLPIRNNVMKDAIIVISVNVISSLLCCFVVFGILGFKGTEVYEACHIHRAMMLAEDFSAVLETCMSVHEYIDEETGDGGGIAFISFAEAIRRLPVSHMFNLTFFIMLLTLGIDSCFGTVEGFIFSCLDIFPQFKRWIVASFTTWLLTLFSILLAFGWGNHIVNLMDYLSVDYPIFSVCFLECIAVGWIYGIGRFAYDLQLMTGKRPNIFILACIKYLSPAIILALIIGSIVTQCIPSFKAFDYYPWNSKTSSDKVAAQMSGRSILLVFVVAGISWIWMPIGAIFAVFKKPLYPTIVPMHFPEAELREENFNHDPKLRRVTRLERILFSGSLHNFPSEEETEKKMDEEAKVEPKDETVVGQGKAGAKPKHETMANASTSN